MPNCDFYGTPSDHLELLSWLFAENTCHVYELSSDFERLLKRFLSGSEVIAQFERCYSTGEKWKTVHLQLYVLGAGPTFAPRRVSLDPKSCAGATYRYQADGWGLVQLYLSQFVSGGLGDSHTNHNTQKRAEAWATAEARGELASWDFKRITAFSSRLNREIRKRSAGKLGSRPVLSGAFKLWQSGVPLLPYVYADSAVELNAEASLKRHAHK